MEHYSVIKRNEVLIAIARMNHANIIKSDRIQLDMVVQIYNSSIQKAETGG
jgi:hypothetical protein